MLTAIKTYFPATPAALVADLLKMSTDGAAYSFSACFGKVRVYRAACPSKLPDSCLESTRLFAACNDLGEDGLIAYRGKLRGFSSAAVIREQNRAVGCQ